MARKKPAKKETKSEFLRRILDKNPDLDHCQANVRWTKAGHAGEISSPLYYTIRRELGIKTVWTWGKADAPNPPSSTDAGGTGKIYQFKITLLDTKPPIWRRIQVSNCTLDKLHEHIQTAMGWTNSHMHHFRIDGKLFGDPLLISNSTEELKYEDSTRTMLSDVLPGGGRRFGFEYEYDFGDGWQHEILFEGQLKTEPGKRYPRCVEGARACPPEDVGGVWGYDDFLKAIADPENEQHEEMIEWVGRRFDPEKFDATKATKAMKAGLPDWRRFR